MLNILKVCNTCSVEKSLDEYYNSKFTKDKHEGKCKSCRVKKMVSLNKLKVKELREYRKQFTERFPDKVYSKNRESRYRRLYNITTEDYYELLETQNSKCAICNIDTPTRKTFDVDHDHETNKVRGLLCNNCNRALGYLQDNPNLLRKAAEYIEFHKVRQER